MRVFDLPAVPDAVSEARNKVTEAATEAAVPEPIKNDLRLGVSELFSNSVKHAGLRPEDSVRLVVEQHGAKIRVCVLDGTAGPSSVSPVLPSHSHEGGRGLVIVDTVADRWGVDPLGGGVWFEIDVPSSPLG